jgi:NAD(P)-dependent dehydrogenase (short-subunit alcohol dehydrogenase family)
MEIRNATVVITGASSGIGRATARTLAGRGARVVLAARREDALAEAAQDCVRAGGEALVVPTDVTDAAAVEALARRALERFGQIDAWVNNAGVYLVGRFEQTPPDAFRRVMEVDFFGTVHGTRAVLPHFLERDRGVLVNVSSMAGAVGPAYLSAYAAAKWAVRGMTQSLREELLDHPDIHACCVMPAAIDTPIFQHAGNFTRRALKALPPVYDVSMVADTIVGLIERPRGEVFAGRVGKAMYLQHVLAPRLTERMLKLMVEKTHFRRGAEPPTPGNLFEPVRLGHGESGGWRRGEGNLLGASGRASGERERVAGGRPA